MTWLWLSLGGCHSPLDPSELPVAETNDHPLVDPCSGAGPDYVPPPEACIEGHSRVDPRRACPVGYCPPDDVFVTISSSEPVPCFSALGSPCEGQTDEGGHFFTYQSPDGAEVELAFGPAIAMDFSQAGVLANLGTLFLRDIPIGDPIDGVPFVTTHIVQELDCIQSIRLDGDRLTGTVHWIAPDVTYQEIPEDECTAGDRILDCRCIFGEVRVPVTVELDLVLQAL